MEYPSVVVMGRIYPEYLKPLNVMKSYQKQGTRVVWDVDDDYWCVDPSNPSRFVSNVFKDQYEDLIRQADACTTTSRFLADKIKRIRKDQKVYIVPNAIDFNDYKERPHRNETIIKEKKEFDDFVKGLTDKETADKITSHNWTSPNNPLVIGYMGAASHWRDLAMIVPAIEKLYEKYDFIFAIHGIVGGDFDSEIQSYNRILLSNLMPESNEYHKEALDFYDKLKGFKMAHKPFAMPEINPFKLSESDFDIGLAPLEDNEFSKAKSCIKFYEYAAVGTPTLASDVEPYKSECNYRAKNTTEDWYNKLEKLIVDKEFRENLAKEQQAWVKENRALEKVAIDWEIALQKESLPGAPKVLNQDKSFLKKLEERWQK